MSRVYSTFLAATMLFCGCAVRDAQIATQTALTAMAEGVNSTAAVVVQELPGASVTTRDSLVAQVREGTLTPAQALEAYDRAMAQWASAIAALEVSREVLLTGQSAFDIWVDTGDLPESWGAFCDDIEEAMGNVLRLVRACGVDVPVALTAAVRYASEVCQITVDFFVNEEE